MQVAFGRRQRAPCHYSTAGQASVIVVNSYGTAPLVERRASQKDSFDFNNREHLLTSTTAS